MKSMTRYVNNIKFNKQRLIYIAIAVVLVFSVVAIFKSRAEINAKKEALAALDQQCEKQQLEIDSLSELLDDSDDEYIERKAREELDYVLPGERVYIVRAGN